jgi:hypothetical protein
VSLWSGHLDGNLGENKERTTVFEPKVGTYIQGTLWRALLLETPWKGTPRGTTGDILVETPQEDPLI